MVKLNKNVYDIPIQIYRANLVKDRLGRTSDFLEKARSKMQRVKELEEEMCMSGG